MNSFNSMRSLIFILAILPCVLGIPIFGGNLLQKLDYYDNKFKSWMNQHDISYNSEDHRISMFHNFARNDDLITAHNSMNLTFTLGHNKFSHLSFDEWKDMMGMGKGSLHAHKRKETHGKLHSTSLLISEEKDLPASVDWAEKGAFVPPKDQGQCGSCWAFSTIGALEGAVFARDGKPIFLSEQLLVDCDNDLNGGDDTGCNGGFMDDAFQWVQVVSKGVCEGKDYPYTSGKTRTPGQCPFTFSNSSTGEITFSPSTPTTPSCVPLSSTRPVSFTDVTPNSDSALLSALSKQPVSVAIQASQPAMQFYKSGVFSAPCGEEIDHGVLAVGYGTLDTLDPTTSQPVSLPYYKVRNSWGPTWGAEGYILMARGEEMNAKQKSGQCGILTVPSYPNLK